MWAFGVMLYEMLYLKLPFEGKNPSEYKKYIMNEEIKFGKFEFVKFDENESISQIDEL